MTEDQIKHMVNRFLSWRLPEAFNPDGGIRFDKAYRSPHGPSGTNLLAATQAEDMVRHMLEGLPAANDHVVGSEPIGYCVWITPTKLAACAKSAKGAFPVYAAPER